MTGGDSTRRDERENVANGVNKNLVTPIRRNRYRYGEGRRHLMAHAGRPFGEAHYFRPITQNAFRISPLTSGSRSLIPHIFLDAFEARIHEDMLQLYGLYAKNVHLRLL